MPFYICADQMLISMGSEHHARVKQILLDPLLLSSFNANVHGSTVELIVTQAAAKMLKSIPLSSEAFKTAPTAAAAQRSAP